MAIKSETEIKWAEINSAYSTDEIDVCRDGFNVLLRVFEKYRKDLPPEEAAEADAAVSSVREFFETVVTSSAGVVSEGRIVYVAGNLASGYGLGKNAGKKLVDLLERNGLLDVWGVMSEIEETICDSGVSDNLNSSVYDKIDGHLSLAIYRAEELGLLEKRGASLELEKGELSL